MKDKTAKERILVVDDAPATLEVIQRNLCSQGYEVYTASDVVQAINLLKKNAVELVVTDLKMPRGSGLDLVKHVRANFKSTEVMMITGYASVNGAVEAMKAGADEYLAKPFTDKELFQAVKTALGKLELRRAGRVQTATFPATRYGLFGKSEAMQRAFQEVVKAASVPATVLITGESGTGKELVARAVHYGSARAAAPFVPVNCGGIPDGLLESELFGHIKGAFTGAVESRAGFFQTAEGGTIFLDEIGEMSIAMQVKLLRVLENKEVCMVGSSKPRKVEVRIIAATNKDLAKEVQKEGFREDLFYRLNVITIALPPLREREDDILLLTHHFIKKYAKIGGKPLPKMSDEVLQTFRNHPWPGNVRELENLVQRLVLMTDFGLIDMPDLPSMMRFSLREKPALNQTLADAEAEHIRQILASVKGNKSKAARILGIDRKTLREKLDSKKVG